MMNLLKKHKIIIYHILFWIPFMLLGNLREMVDDPKNYFFSPLDVLFSHLPNICTVYLCIYICKKYANPTRIFHLILATIAVFLFSCLNWYVTGYHIRAFIRAVGPDPGPFDFLNFGVTVLWVFVRYALIGFGYYYASESVKRERKLRLIEKEKHEAEYAFLRSQINPHFLNNTLNFFVAKSLPLSEELADGIITLSEIMRYSLEIDKDDRTTLIDEEVEHIKNVIKINQLRFNHKLQLDFNIKGNMNGVRIIPLILITVVENILKHGNCTDKTNPVIINLNLNAVEKYIQLNTWNKKKKGPKELSSGIGMDNIKKRLAHHYEKNFSLIIKETEIDYTLDLTVPYTLITDNSTKINPADQVSFFDPINIQPINPKPYTS